MNYNINLLMLHIKLVHMYIHYTNYFQSDSLELPLLSRYMHSLHKKITGMVTGVQV